MADRDDVVALARLLGGVARAHHEATGGENPGWADWYAHHLEGEVDPLIGFSPDAALIEEWLVEADRRYRSEAPDMKWPYFYAELILDSFRDDGASTGGST